MGILYSVYPLDSEARDMLPTMGVTDLPIQDGSNPTPSELRAVLLSLDGFKVTFYDPPEHEWSAWVQHAADPEDEWWTLVHMPDYRGENEPTALWFEKGRPELILTILVHVAAGSGPLVILADGENPIVVQGTDDPLELYRHWGELPASDEDNRL